jgi:sugar/nucleoside kinase (ribokinase family)
MPIPDFLVLGHLTRDEHADGSHTLGGAATFAAIAARELGYRAAILTSAADDFPQPQLLRDIEIVRVPSPTTTTFRNIYQQGKRQQHVRDVASQLAVEHLPEDWRNVKIALFGPLVAELQIDLVHAFSDETLIGISPQGWMRQWDAAGRVKPRAWQEAAAILPHADVLILSHEDLGGYTASLASYVELAPLVVLTRGEHGCTIYRRHEPPLDVPAFPAQVVDPTGAGDTFATAFLIRQHETNDLLEAARFANAAASLAIESMGAATMPTREQVEQRLEK